MPYSKPVPRNLYFISHWKVTVAFWYFWVPYVLAKTSKCIKCLENCLQQVNLSVQFGGSLEFWQIEYNLELSNNLSALQDETFPENAHLQFWLNLSDCIGGVVVQRPWLVASQGSVLVSHICCAGTKHIERRHNAAWQSSSHGSMIIIFNSISLFQHQEVFFHNTRIEMGVCLLTYVEISSCTQLPDTDVKINELSIYQSFENQIDSQVLMASG